MFCTNCGAEVSDGAKFCDTCGAPVGAGDADKTAVAPPGAPTPPASPTPEQGSPAPRTHGSSVVAVVMSVVALVAVVALVVVVANPFGAGSQPASEQPAQEQPADGADPAEEPSSAGEKDDEGAAQDAGPEDDAGADDAAADEADAAAGTQQNNVVVVVEGNDHAPAPPRSTVVHTSSDDYILPYSVTYEYSTSEISHLSDWELYLARNEIYARHGREFRNDDLARYFGDKSWYTPLYSPDDFDARVDSFLSYTEQRNAATILSLEQSRGSAYI